eukprot:snap_masked-scaffold_81-processed-gene-0.13-mRNA-1 protein AED:1.00 eAED:1.00 QI:0/-1/0/0/-1/1/1/0/101
MINKPGAYLQRCKSIDIRSDLKLQRGIDTYDRRPILVKIKETQEVDQSNREARLLDTTNMKLKCKNGEIILTVMRSYVKSIFGLLQGLTISKETEKIHVKY